MLTFLNRSVKTICSRSFGRNQLQHIICYRSNSTRNILKSPYTDVTVPNIPLHQYVWQNVHKWPNNIAVECGVSGKKYSYNELYLKCKKFSSSMRRLGLKKGETIGIILPNIPEFPVAYLGALESGLTVTTVNPNYSKDEIIYHLECSNTSWVICHPANLKTLLEARNHFKDKLNIICTHNLDGSSPGYGNGIVHFEDLVDDSVNTEECFKTSADFDMSDTALIAFSSGTTGQPKGTCLTHNSIMTNLAQLGHPKIFKLIETTNEHQDVIPACLPFFHVYGSIVILLQSLINGSKLITLPQFDPKLFLNILETNSNIVQYLVPPIVFFLGSNEGVKEKHLRGTREVLTGGAPCSSHDISKVKAKTNSKIIFSQGYGMTEATAVLTLYKAEGTDDYNISTVGKMLSNTSGKILDIVTGEALPPNKSGELCFKGPQLMKYYLNNPKATSETIDSDGWIHTGDIGYYDQDGFFYITDRLKELIKVNAFQVAPAELEETLRKYPGVVDAGVVGVPCERTGETPVAFVQTIPGAKISEDDIKAFVASKLSKHKHLSSVRFIQAIPKTPSGKIIRKNLKKIAIGV